MKILVLQLARLGDIYQSWPALRALQRRYPEAQIDVMVRPRFGDAFTGLEVVSRKILLPTQDLLTPLVNSAPNTKEALARLDYFLNDVRSEKYDLIVNFSFSPLSSYIVHALETSKTEVIGYTRHKDGFFNMVGGVSSYFYAQVGIDRYNRIHVTDLLAAMVGTELTESDWKDCEIVDDNLSLSNNYVVFHIGASEAHKSLPSFKWSRILKYFSEYCPDTEIVLIGSPQEKSISDIIVGGVGDTKNIVNLVGQTKIPELFPIIRKARLLVGCDSAPIHIASLTRTPCLNIRIGQINFWETGPRSPGSYILKGKSADEIVSEYAAAAIQTLIEGKQPTDLIRFSPETSGYEVSETSQDRFCWDLIAALYLGGSYPMTEDLRFFQGIEKLNDINNVILEQLVKIDKAGLKKIKPILDRADEVIQALGDLVPELQIFVRWLKAERAQMPPGSFENLTKSTAEMHLRLKQMIRPYIMEGNEAEEGGAHG